MQFGLFAFAGFAWTNAKVIILPQESIWRDHTGAWMDSNAYDVSYASCFLETSWDYNVVSSIVLPAPASPQRIQYDALMSFYTSTGGASWKINDNWGVGDPCFRNWYGVTCGCSGFVTKLYLPDNKLTGTIPSTISQLSSLQELSIHTTGRSTQSILNDNANDISGPMPSLALLQNLRVVDVSLNSITSLPADISQNTALEVLSASGNLLSLLPTNLGALSNLRVLDLSDNVIADTFPINDVCSLLNIYVFNVGNNSISGQFYDPCLMNLNPLVFDIAAPYPGILGAWDSLTGDVPLALTSTWTNIKDGYISFYLQFGLTGHFASTCSDLRICRWFNFGSQEDFAWIASGTTIPQIVFDTINKAVEY